jgi:hypothetical protein
MNKEEIQEIIDLLSERKILKATRILTKIYNELEIEENKKPKMEVQ